jgi:hypothetical protein
MSYGCDGKADRRASLPHRCQRCRVLEGCQVLVTRVKPHIGCFGVPLAASEVLPHGCTLGEILAALCS